MAKAPAEQRAQDLQLGHLLPEERWIPQAVARFCMDSLSTSPDASGGAGRQRHPPPLGGAL